MVKSAVKLPLLFGLIIFASQAYSQVCWLVKDSVFEGEDSSAFAIYAYQGGLLRTIEYTDSAATSVQSIDSVFYNVNAKQSKVSAYDPMGSTPFRTTTLSYDSNDRISRIHVLEDNGFGPNTIAHDISYNSSNEIISMKVDPSSVSGTTDSFDWNFENMVWQNGNVQSLDLVGDLLGIGLMDTIEFSVTYDSQLNIRRLLPIEEVGSLIEQISSNNIETLITVNDEILGPAGILAFDRVYTYFSTGEVSSIHEKEGLFNEEEYKLGFRFQCSGIGLEESTLSNLSIYPNPAKDVVYIQSEQNIKSIRLLNLNGQLLASENGSGSNHSLSLRGLNPGLYLLEVWSQGQAQITKIIVE